jgi:hypothetical protein
MAINEVEISFKADVEATSHEQIERIVQSMIEQMNLGNYQWRITHAPEPLTREEEIIKWD